MGTEGGDGAGDGAKGLTRDDVTAMIREALSGVMAPAAPSGKAPSGGGSVAEQVAAEVARIKQQEDRKARDARIDAELEHLKGKVTPVPAQEPVALKRTTAKWWGDRK